MKLVTGCRLALCLGLVTAFTCVHGSRTEAQDINLDPSFGSVTLKSGFVPDPYVKQMIAGGSINTNLGGVNAWIGQAPDFRLYYTAGSFPLTFYVNSAADTTLLIHLPDGRWVADDDSGGNRNPLVRFAQPPSGRYDIYIGTFQRGTAPAILYITELK